MAFLVPLLLPLILDATTNLGIGVSNALQGDSSSISFQIGSKVFTNAKGFPLGQLPFELRELIVLMALEESRSLILPPPILIHPARPLTQAQFSALQRRSPLNPSNPHYMSVVGEHRSANGYPISSWRWLRVSREWWAILRPGLWRDTVVGGFTSYHNLLSMMEDPDFHFASFIQSLSLLDGFTTPDDLHRIIRHSGLKNVISLSILPTYPSSPSDPFSAVPLPFAFGLQLIPVRSKPLSLLSLGLPLDICTNSTSRQHLAELRPSQLGIALQTPTLELFNEITSLVGASVKTLSIRYIPALREPLIPPELFLSEPLRAYAHLIIYLPRITAEPRLPYVGQADPATSFSQRLVDLVASDDELFAKVEIWALGGLSGEVVLGGVEDERLWPAVQAEEVKEAVESGDLPAAPPEHWQRQTDLRLFGGLIGVRMEARKTA